MPKDNAAGERKNHEVMPIKKIGPICLYVWEMNPMGRIDVNLAHGLVLPLRPKLFVQSWLFVGLHMNVTGCTNMAEWSHMLWIPMETPIWLDFIILHTQRHHTKISCFLAVCLQMDLPIRLEFLTYVPSYIMPFSYHYNAGFAKWLLTIFSKKINKQVPILSTSIVHQQYWTPFGSGGSAALTSWSNMQ